MNRSTAVIGLIVLTAFVVGIIGAMLLSRQDTVSSAIVYPTPRSLPVVRLSDHNGNELDRDRFLGGWDMLFFGFTHCPDICPTTLQQLSLLSAGLADLDPARRPRIWLISVDPQRDTPQVLQRYLAHFGAEFSGITGSPEQIALFAAGFGVAHQRVPEGDDYTMAHTAALFLIDPDAQLHALFSTPLDMAVIENDYRILTR